jgi:hypothetical protein
VDAQGKVEGQLGSIDYTIERRRQESGVGGVTFAEISFEDGSSASIARDRERGILIATVDGTASIPESVTRAATLQIDELIVRQLKRARGDQVLLKVLPVASRLAKRVAR